MATDIRAINLTIASALGLNTEHLVSATLTIKPDRVPEVVATYNVGDPAKLIAALGKRSSAETSADVAAAFEESGSRTEARICGLLRDGAPSSASPAPASTELRLSSLSTAFQRLGAAWKAVFLPAEAYPQESRQTVWVGRGVDRSEVEAAVAAGKQRGAGR